MIKIVEEILCRLYFVESEENFVSQVIVIILCRQKIDSECSRNETFQISRIFHIFCLFQKLVYKVAIYTDVPKKS